MASSTTVPMASTRAKSVSKLSVKPAMERQANVPTSDTIIDMEGMRVALKSCRKKYTTSTTKRMATSRVSSTFAMDAKRKSLLDIILTNFMPLGRSLLNSSSLALTRSFVSFAFAPASWKQRNVTPGCPFASPWKA